MKIRRVEAARGAGWYADGWKIVKGQIGMWILLILVYFALALVLGLIPFIGGLIMALIGPGLIAGFYLAARNSEVGNKVQVELLFGAFTDPDKRGPMLTLGAINIALTIVMIVVIGLMIGGAMGAGQIAENDPEAMMLVFQGLGMVGLLVILALSLAVAMAMIYAAPLVMFKDMAPVEAVKTSFKAALINWLPLLVFGLIFIPLTVIATIPLMLGWLFLMPVVLGALYTSFSEIFGMDASPPPQVELSRSTGMHF